MKGRFALGLLVLALGASAVFADDKVFKLKNGRKIQGELVEETATTYIVRTSGGQTEIPKENVASVESPPPPAKPFLEPEKKKEPDAPPTARPDRPEKRDRETAPVVAGAPLASEAEVAAARKALLAVPEAGGDDAATRKRDVAIQSIVKSTPVEALVAIAAEPETEAQPTPPRERLLAGEILAQRVSAERVRPLVARGVAGIDLAAGVPHVLLGLVDSVGDTADGVIYATLIAKVADILKRGDNVAPLVEGVQWHVKQAQFLALFKLVLASPEPVKAELFAEACRKALASAQASDRDAWVLAAWGVIQSDKLPPFAALGPAITAIGGAGSRESVNVVSRLLGTLEVSNPEASEKPARDACLRRAYQVLVTAWTDESRERLLRALADAGSTERRMIVLDGFEVFPKGTPPVKSFVVAVADRMGDARTDDERKAFANVLAAMTGRDFGPNTDAWRKYARTLR